MGTIQVAQSDKARSRGREAIRKFESFDSEPLPVTDRPKQLALYLIHKYGGFAPMVEQEPIRQTLPALMGAEVIGGADTETPRVRTRRLRCGQTLTFSTGRSWCPFRLARRESVRETADIQSLSFRVEPPDDSQKL